MIREIIRELIGRAGQTARLWINQRPVRATKDSTRTDYEYYDRVRRCDGSVRGLEIAGLFMKPIGSKVRGWTLGKMPSWKTDNPDFMTRINEWFTEHASQIGDGYEEALGLGDYFIVVNADLSLTLVTPDVVEPLVDEGDYSQVIGWRITQRFDHPTQLGRHMIEINEYTATERVRRVQFETGPEEVQRFPNLLRRVPVIKVSNNVQSNELWGKPEAAALVTSNKGLLHRYNEILDAGTDGNLHQGRSTPVIKFGTLAGMQAFQQTYGETQTDEETGEENAYLDWDSDKLTMMVDGEFKWESPGAFIGETEKLLAILYWLMLEHIELPEFVMGTAVTSSKASTETQMPIFTQYIEKKRGQIGGWIKELAEVVGGMIGLIEGFAVGDLQIVWEALTDADGKLTLETVQWAFSEGLLDKATALMHAPIEVDDIEGVLEKADSEREEERDLMATERAINETPSPTLPRKQGGETSQGDGGEEDDIGDAAA